jgi:hypothetical protein
VEYATYSGGQNLGHIKGLQSIVIQEGQLCSGYRAEVSTGESISWIDPERSWNEAVGQNCSD